MWYTDVMSWIWWENSIRISEHTHIITDIQSRAYIIAAAEAKWEANRLALCKPKVCIMLLQQQKRK